MEIRSYFLIFSEILNDNRVEPMVQGCDWSIIVWFQYLGWGIEDSAESLISGHRPCLCYDVLHADGNLNNRIIFLTNGQRVGKL
jgi:murein endopeptidase